MPIPREESEHAEGKPGPAPKGPCPLTGSQSWCERTSRQSPGEKWGGDTRHIWGVGVQPEKKAESKICDDCMISKMYARHTWSFQPIRLALCRTVELS